MQSRDVLPPGDAPAASLPELVPIPAQGRRFSGARSPRLGDVTPKGRLRLDAVARYLQDIANDDAIDAGLENAMAWVVRRCEIRVERFPTFREPLDLVTFCGGYGSRWAERRTQLRGGAVPLIDAAALWVSIDAASGRPSRIPEAFVELYGEAAGGRKVGARLQLGEPSPATVVAAERFPLRFVDYDLLGHVNNSFAWVVAEELLSARSDLRAPLRVEAEYRGAIERGCALAVAVDQRPDGFDAWLIDQPRGAVLVALRVGSIAGESQRNSRSR